MHFINLIKMIYQSFFNNFNHDNNSNFFEEEGLNPFELNFLNDHQENDNSFEVQPLNEEGEQKENLNEQQEQELCFDDSINPYNPLNLSDNEMGEQFKYEEMVLDEEERSQINEEIIPEIKVKEKREKIFEITKEKKDGKNLPKYPRIDDCKILFRTKINKQYIKNLNEAIKESDLPKVLKKIIHTPSYKKFTQKVKCESNLNDLQKTMFDILTINKEAEKNPRQNHENIQCILNYHMNNPTERVETIIQLIQMKYQEVIEMFYDSNEFNEFKEDEQVKYYNEEVKRQKKIDLFQRNGLITLFKSYYQKGEKDEKMVGRKRNASH